MMRPSSPATSAPISGKKTMAWITSGQPFIMLTSSTAIEPRLRIEDDEDGKADGRLGGGDGEDHQREDLPGEIAELRPRSRRS